MFGGKKVQALEAQASELKKKLELEVNHGKELENELKTAQEKISALEKKLAESEQETLRRDLNSAKAEVEGLRELYTRKNQEFDDSVEKREEDFAKEAARQRYDLEQEIEENRQENREYVSDTIQSFSETYNYYLNQIRILMDALSHVAAKTGKGLFSGKSDDMKANFGLEMAEEIRASAGSLENHPGDIVLIGGQEDTEEPVEPAPAVTESCKEEETEKEETNCEENSCEQQEKAEDDHDRPFQELLDKIDEEIQSLQQNIDEHEDNEPAKDGEEQG